MFPIDSAATDRDLFPIDSAATDRDLFPTDSAATTYFGLDPHEMYVYLYALRCYNTI